MSQGVHVGLALIMQYATGSLQRNGLFPGQRLPFWAPFDAVFDDSKWPLTTTKRGRQDHHICMSHPSLMTCPTGIPDPKMAALGGPICLTYSFAFWLLALDRTIF